MLKKFLLTALAAFTLSTPLASAEVVTVKGTGASETAAVQDAKRNAVEQVAGTAVRAKSSMADLELIFDAIETRTQGYVNSCEILSTSSKGGLVTVTARIDVSSEPNSELMRDVEVVMNLNDPRLAVVIGHYGDDGGDVYKRDAARCAAAIREELAKRGFTHVVEEPVNIDYIIRGDLSVAKGRSIALPNFSGISTPSVTPVETGLTKFEAMMDGKIKRADTDEFVGEFHANGESIGLADGGIDNQAVANLAGKSAQSVRELFNREARKIFKSVKILVSSGDALKILDFEEILAQTQGITGVHVRSLAGGQCTIDVDTDLSPQNVYRALYKFAGEDLKIGLQGFTSTTLILTID